MDRAADSTMPGHSLAKSGRAQPNQAGASRLLREHCAAEMKAADWFGEIGLLTPLRCADHA